MKILFFLRFLKNNRLYSLVTILGFAISLTFVLLLGIYVTKEFAVDEFQANKDRIFLLARENNKAAFANPIPDLIKDNCPEVECYTRVLYTNLTVANSQSNKMNIKCLFVDSSFFNIFSYQLIEGDQSNALPHAKTAVLTSSFARRHFQGKEPVGQSIHLNESTDVLVTGVVEDFTKNTQMPECDIVLNYQTIAECWGEEILTSLDNSSFGMYFMAKPGTNLQAKDSIILNLFHKINYGLYTDGHAREVKFIPLTSVYFSGPDTGFANIRTGSKTYAYLYMAIAILILLVSVLNYINLSVAQLGKRGKEVSLKKIIGTDNYQIVVQFIVESIVITFVAFCIALLFAFLSENFFNNVLGTQLELSRHCLNFTFASIIVLSSCLIGGASGLIPAYIIAQFKPIETIKGYFSYKLKTSYSKVLITFQFAIVFVLLTCGIFIVKQTVEMRGFDMGFNRNNIIVLDNMIEPERYALVRSVFESIPGVEEVSFSTGTPVDGGTSESFEQDGQMFNYQSYTVDSSFFNILGIKVSRTVEPIQNNSVFLNQVAYKALNPVDNIVRINNKQYSLAGVMDNVQFQSLHQAPSSVVVQLSQNDRQAWSILVKLKSPDQKAINEVKEAYLKLNGGEPFEIYYLDKVVKDWYAKEYNTSKVLMAFTILTIFILLMGVFAMSMYFIQQREKEIGIRKVNGATTSNLLLVLNSDFIRSISIAFLVAVPVIYYVMQQWLMGFSYKTGLYWWIFAAVYLLVFLISMASISLQSIKAANANPIESLMNE